MQRARQKDNPQQVNPAHRRDLVVAPEYKITSKGQSFLLYDSGCCDARILIFSTAESLRYLASCEQWLSDGTFRSVPSIFTQLYTVHGYKRGKSLPLVYMLAPNKSENTYNVFLKQLRKLQKSLKPKWIMVDFELAFVNAFKSHFAETEIHGCLFHFGQCLWRNVQQSNLQVRYNTDIEFAVNVRKLMALAFVPEDHVIDAYNDLIQSDYYDDHEQELSPIVDYFEVTWLGKVSRSGRKRSEPHFPIKMWNCYMSILEDRIRTNNFMEGWHHGFNESVGTNHAHIGKFIGVLQAQQNVAEVAIAQIDSGMNVVVKQRREYRLKNARLKSVATEYDADNKLLYITNIARILSLG